MLTHDIKHYINSSVLCWLASASADNMPNVSPKEIFTYHGDSTVLVANIASPRTVQNIQANEQVCISFIDIFVQKGYQLKGRASIVKKGHPSYLKLSEPLLKMTGGKFPISSIIEIKIEQAKPILAPRYVLYPETTEAEQIVSAMETYGVEKLKD